MMKPQSQKKKLSGYTGCLHIFFGVCQKQQGVNLFKELHAGNGIKGSFTIFDNKILIAIATVKQYRD